MAKICIALEGTCTAQLSSRKDRTVEENAKHLRIASGALLGCLPSRERAERDGESPLAVWGLGQEGRGGERRYVAVVVGL